MVSTRLAKHDTFRSLTILVAMDKTKCDILLFDGDCDFCQNNIDRIAKHINSKTSLMSYQNFDFNQSPASQEEAQSAIVFIASAGEHYLGSAALAKWLRTGNRAAMTIGKIMELPGIAQAAKLVYILVSKNKTRFSSAPHCSQAKDG